MKYPFMSNWISYKKIRGTNKYCVRNHFLDEEMLVDENCISFIEQLNGKRNPMKILSAHGMSKHEAHRYINELEDSGLIRSSKKIPYMSFMRTIFLVKDSCKYKEISVILLVLELLLFFPAIYILFRYSGMVALSGNAFGGGSLYIWLGLLCGLLFGAVFHELFHAISCIAFTPHNVKSVLEFGIMFEGFPAAYTLMDSKAMSKMGRIVTDIAGVVANIIFASGTMLLCTISNKMVTFLFYMAVVNIEMALANCLIIESLDGRHAIEEIIGEFENCGSKNPRKISEAQDQEDDDEKLSLSISRIFKITKIIYPALLIFNIALCLGW